MAHKVCPVWVGYLLLNPIRQFSQNPEKILSEYIKTGMLVLDIGPAMGYFSIPMAKITGKTGKVVCVDVQEKMLEKLGKRAEKKGVGQIIEKVVADNESLNINQFKNSADFALSFAVAHEVENREKFFMDIYQSLKPEGRMLFCEPIGHVSEDNFNESVNYAKWCGFHVEKNPVIKKSHAVLMKK